MTGIFATIAIAIIGSLAVSILIVLVLTPFVGRLAERAGALAYPQGRKLHTHPIPQWGGLAIFAGWIGGFAIGTLILSAQDSLKLVLAQSTLPLIGILLGGITMLVVGAVDDLRELRPLVKLTGQAIATLIPISFGVRIHFLSLPWSPGYTYLPDWQSWLLSFLWIVGLTNAINLIDGLDGLAAGVSSIAAATLLLLALGQKLFLTAIALAAVCGAALGFLRYNFNPAQIFMGDTGAQLLGYLFATLAIVGTMKTAVAVGALLVTVIALGYPVLDTMFAVIRRIAEGKPFFTPDKGHLHHRLLNYGLNQRQAVLILYLLSFILCLTALLIARLV